MFPYKRTLTKTGSYAGVVKTDTIDIPKDYVLQRMLIDIRGTMDITVGVSVLVEDAMQRLLKSVKLNLTGNFSGNKSVIDLNGVDIYFINFYDYGEGLERVTKTAIANGVDVSVQLMLDFRLAKNDPDDFTVGIPLYHTSSANLILEWDTPAIGYGTNTSNWSLTAKITLFEGIPDTPEEFEAAKKNPIYTLVASDQTADTNTTSAEERNTDIATGHLLRRLMFQVRTTGNLRSDVEIDRIFLAKINKIFFDEVDWDFFGAEDETDYSLANYDGDRGIKGVIVFDFARAPMDEQGRIFGEDLTNLKSGDMKLKIWKNNVSSKLRYVEEAIVPRAVSK